MSPSFSSGQVDDDDDEKMDVNESLFLTVDDKEEEGDDDDDDDERLFVDVDVEEDAEAKLETGILCDKASEPTTKTRDHIMPWSC